MLPPAAGEGGAAAPDEQPKRLTDDEFKEALYRRLMASHRTVDADLEKIASAKKAVGKQRTEVRNQLKQAGFYLSNIDDVLDAGSKRAGRPEEQAKVDQLAWMRELEGLPVARTGEQLDMWNRLPETQKTALDWELEGYNEGVRAERACIAPDGIPPEFIPVWTKGYHNGQERNAWALSAEGVNPEVAPGGAGVDFVPAPIDHDAPEEDEDPETEDEAAAEEAEFFEEVEEEPETEAAAAVH